MHLRGRTASPVATPSPDGFNTPPDRGSFDGEWFTEECPGASRLGIRIHSVLHHETSPFQKISVYDTAFFGRLLTLDDVVMLKGYHTGGADAARLQETLEVSASYFGDPGPATTDVPLHKLGIEGMSLETDAFAITD